MFGAILKATNSYFLKSMTFCRSIYVKKVMKLLAFIFEQPSYVLVVTKRPERFIALLTQNFIKNNGKIFLSYYFADGTLCAFKRCFNLE